MTIFTKKITFTNVKIAYGGCDCCGENITYHIGSGPYVVNVMPDEQPVENHAKITFGSNVVDFDYSIEE